jgi:hypothetical protein
MRVLAIALTALSSAAPAYAANSSCSSVLAHALQRADMPSTIEGPSKPDCKSADTLHFIGTGLKGAGYSYTWPVVRGSFEKEWHVTGEVFVAPSVAAAKQLFADGKAAQHGFFSDFSTDGATALSLPSFGDEQLALLGKDAGGPQAMVFVRRRATVWELRIGHSLPTWKVTKNLVVGMLETYAAKQKLRVGTG